MKKLILSILLIVPLICFGQLELPYSLKVLNDKPADGWYYNTSGNIYTGTAEVLSQVVASVRYQGQTFNVSGLEYWFKDGIDDGDLVLKTGGGGWPLTGDATYTGHVNIDGDFDIKIGKSNPVDEFHVQSDEIIDFTSGSSTPTNIRIEGTTGKAYMLADSLIIQSTIDMVGRKITNVDAAEANGEVVIYEQISTLAGKQNQLSNGNGTTVATTPDRVNIGGALTQNTTITGASGTYDFAATGMDGISLSGVNTFLTATGDGSIVGGDDYAISISDDLEIVSSNGVPFIHSLTDTVYIESGLNGFTPLVGLSISNKTYGTVFTDGRTIKKGIRYASSGYETDSLSLTSKKYVDEAVAAGIGGLEDGSGTTIVPTDIGVAVNIGGPLSAFAEVDGNGFAIAFNDMEAFDVNSLADVNLGAGGNINLNAYTGYLSAQTDYTYLTATNSLNISTPSLDLTGSLDATLYSDNEVDISTGGVSNIELLPGAMTIEAPDLIIDASDDITINGDVSTETYSKVNFVTGKFTGGLNNNNTHTGTNAFQFGDGNSIAASFGAAQFGESGITTSAGNASFMSGEANYIAAYGGVAQGRGVSVTGAYSFAGGWYSPSGTSGSTNAKAPQVSGSASFGFYTTDTGQTDGHGVLAASSAILAGSNHNIPSSSPRSVILGGDAIKARASDSDEVYVPQLNINTVPTRNDTLSQILARDFTTGKIKYVKASTFGGSGSFWSLGSNTSLTTDVAVSHNAHVMRLGDVDTNMEIQDGVISQTAGEVNLTSTHVTITSELLDIVTDAGFIGTNGTDLQLSSSGGNLSLELTNPTGDMIVSDLSTTTHGLEYAADYSSEYTNRSLIDKEYADNLVIAAGSGTVTSITATSPLTGGVITTTGSIGIQNAAADGSTKGASSFTAADFNASSGLISIDYTNGTSATTSVKGFLTSTDWTTFNNKVATSRSISTTSPLSGGGDLSANRTLSIADAAADGTTKGASTYTAADFNTSSGVVSIDYTNGQAATGSVKGLLTSADWTKFNSKLSTITLSGDVTGTGGSSITTTISTKYAVDLSTPSTAGGTVTLDLNSQFQRMFLGSASFATGKTMAVTNITNSRVFDFNFEVTNVAATLTLPAIWLMADSNFNTGTRIWTPPATGKYEMSGTYDGTNWRIKIAGPYL